jgi:hypothetical protein
MVAVAELDLTLIQRAGFNTALFDQSACRAQVLTLKILKWVPPLLNCLQMFNKIFPAGHHGLAFTPASRADG